MTPHTISKSAPVTSEPKAGDKTVIDGKPYVWIPNFDWIEDHCGEGGGTFAAEMYENGNKIGVMGGTTVGNPGDEFTGNKVGVMGGTVGSDGDITSRSVSWVAKNRRKRHPLRQLNCQSRQAMSYT